MVPLWHRLIEAKDHDADRCNPNGQIDPKDVGPMEMLNNERAERRSGYGSTPKPSQRST